MYDSGHKQRSPALVLRNLRPNIDDLNSNLSSWARPFEMNAVLTSELHFPMPRTKQRFVTAGRIAERELISEITLIALGLIAEEGLLSHKKLVVEFEPDSR